MRLSKRVIGIAAVVALATGMATTDRALATTSGTQIEYVTDSDTTFAERTVALWRLFVTTSVFSIL